MSKRKRFKLSACGSSRGGYVQRAHQRYIKEEHLKNEVTLVNIEIHIPKKYFVKCFGKLIEVTEREAAILKRTTNIIIK